MVGAGKPSGDAVGVVLVDGAVLAREAPAPHPGVDLGDGGAAGLNIPPVEQARNERAPPDRRAGRPNRNSASSLILWTWPCA
jgi:hypothetical protein